MAREQRQVTGPFVEEEGLVGVFTRNEAEGAHPNGSVVEKINGYDLDLAPNGTKGVVVGSLEAADHAEHIAEMTGTSQDLQDLGDEKFVYFVQWENAQSLVLGIREIRVKLLEGEPHPFDPEDPTPADDETMAQAQPVVEIIPASAMTILPPAPGVCQVCAADHDPQEPHTPNSLYWQTKRQMEGLGPATWEDALVDCTEPVRESWITALELKGGKIDREKLDRLLAEQEQK